MRMDFGGAGKLTQWLRILILEEDLNSISSIHMATYKWSLSPVPGDSTPDIGWQEACVWCAFIQTETYTYNTIFFKIGGFRSLGGCSWRLSQDLGLFLSESVPLVCSCVLRSQIFEFGKNYHHIHQVASASLKWIFCCCDKTSWPKQLREGILCLQFQRDEWQKSIKQVAGIVKGTSFTLSTVWRDLMEMVQVLISEPIPSDILLQYSCTL